MKKNIKKSIKSFCILLFCVLPFSAFAQLNWSGTQYFYTNTTITQNINLTGHVTLDMLESVTVTITGVISGNYSLTKYLGTLILTGNNTYSGPTYLSAGGALFIGYNGGTTGAINGTISISSSYAGVILARTGDYTFSTDIIGEGEVSIWVNTPTTVTFSGYYGYTGKTVITDMGNLCLTATSSIQNSSNIVLGTGAKLDISAGNQTVKALNDLSYYNSSEVILGSKTLTINNTTDCEFSGKFSGNGGGIIKTGTGKLWIKGSNHTATGTFTHNQGEVLLSNLANWAGHYSLSANGILNLSGSVGSLSLAGGTMKGEIWDNNPNSKLTVSGAVTASASQPTTINITRSYPPPYVQNRVFIEANSGITSPSPYVLVPGESVPCAFLSVNTPTQLLYSDGSVPLITTTTLPNAEMGIPYSVQLEATTTSCTPITWSTYPAYYLPPGLTLSTDGLISGTPTTSGLYDFYVYASNYMGSSSKDLSIMVVVTGDPPIITTTELPVGIAGTAYSVQLEATGTAPISWSCFQDEYLYNYGLTFSETGLLSGTLPNVGPIMTNFYFKAANSLGSDIKGFQFTIYPAPVAPTITTTSLPNGTTGTAYSQQLVATGTAPITWTLESGNLPTGLTLSSAGLISGTPTTVGTFNFTVQATNTAGSNTKSLSIIINAATVPPTITTTSLPGGLVGTAYNQTFTATGTTPITWSLQSGTLPTGLSLSTAGVISGTPTTAGTSNFTVRATNSAGNATKALSIVITASVVKPTITTTTLPNGKTGTAYSAQLEATGTAPISWALASGNLPTGLTLYSGGTISGTPTAIGTFNFTVQATNSAGNATKALSIKIEDGVGVSENEMSGITVYPNPTTGELSVISEQLSVESIEIFDVYGRKCHASLVTCHASLITINISDLATGMYFIKIRTELGEVVRKVVKE